MRIRLHLRHSRCLATSLLVERGQWNMLIDRQATQTSRIRPSGQGARPYRDTAAGHLPHLSVCTHSARPPRSPHPRAAWSTDSPSLTSTAAPSCCLRPPSSFRPSPSSSHPRVHRHRYHGVLAPNARLRPHAVAFGRPELVSEAPATKTEVDAATDPPVVSAILLHRDLPHKPPPRLRIRPVPARRLLPLRLPESGRPGILLPAPSPPIRASHRPSTTP